MGASGKGQTIDQQIGGRITALREERGLSLAELAQSALLTSHDLRRIESGEDRASARTLYLICRALDCPVTALFKGRAWL